MRLRTGLTAVSVLVIAFAVFSLAQTSASHAHPTKLSSISTVTQPSPPKVKTNRRQQAAHSPTRPRPHPTLAPATVMTAPSQAAAPAQNVSTARMVGQELMVSMTGTVADAALLARIRAGQVGGVILYSDNITSPTQVAALTAQLQNAATAGGNPPLLISTDQEGPTVKRLPWAPPTLAPAQMGAAGPTVSESQGHATGIALHEVGINVDLAPVADVAHSTSAFIWQQQRSFGMNAQTVTENTAAFAEGLQAAGVAATAKHFPGLGSALTDTDYAQQALQLTTEDLAPYHTLIADQIPLIMVSLATYTNVDRFSVAALSPPIITGLLRDGLNFQGVVITDDLQRPTGQDTAQAAIAASQAGADIILVSTTEDGGSTAYAAMLTAAQAGQISGPMIAEAYKRILALKANYAASSG
jgi:beta-N-acetylhexosaminidase